MRRLIQLLLLLAMVLAAASLARAQGGPPFITDDPGTPGNRQWEINVGFLGSHNPANSSYQTPNIDINYGWGDRIQLMASPYLAVATDENNTTRAGLGESLLGIKWRPYEHHKAGEPKSDENMDFSRHLSPGLDQQPHQRRSPGCRGAGAAILSADGSHGQTWSYRF